MALMGRRGTPQRRLSEAGNGCHQSPGSQKPSPLLACLALALSRSLLWFSGFEPGPRLQVWSPWLPLSPPQNKEGAVVPAGTSPSWARERECPTTWQSPDPSHTPGRPSAQSPRLHTHRVPAGATRPASSSLTSGFKYHPLLRAAGWRMDPAFTVTARHAPTVPMPWATPSLGICHSCPRCACPRALFLAGCSE